MFEVPPSRPVDQLAQHYGRALACVGDQVLWPEAEGSAVRNADEAASWLWPHMLAHEPARSSCLNGWWQHLACPASCALVGLSKLEHSKVVTPSADDL
jgi:hypothetical protein